MESEFPRVVTSDEVECLRCPRCDNLGPHLVLKEPEIEACPDEDLEVYCSECDLYLGIVNKSTLRGRE